MEQRLARGEVGTAWIAGVTVHSLRVIEDERGALLHMLRADSPLFRRFGEVYFSEVRAATVKAWRRHTQMTQHFAVPVGRVKFVIYDDRAGSPSEHGLVECELGRPDAYQLLVVPPLVWYGFKGLGISPSIVANCSDIPHDPAEIVRLDHRTGSIPYTW